MRVLVGCVVALLLAACRVALLSEVATVPAAGADASAMPAALDVARLGDGAAPGGAEGSGGFVPRGTRRNFYAGPGGRLWYYLNNYYWISETSPRDDLWIRAEVHEQFTGLRRWPRGEAVPPTAPKETLEYWAVGPTGRSVRLDNHKDYCRLDDHYTEGAIEVRVTLTLGRLQVREDGGVWGRPRENYVLEFRNYRDDRGIGADRVRFEALDTEAVTVWGYRIPWATHPQRLTRSSWKRLEVPTWELLERRAP